MRDPSRWRQRLQLLIVAALVGCFVVWWTTYAGIYVDSRYRQLPAGASAEIQRTTVTALSLVVSDQLETTSDVEPADPDAVWVVAELEAVRHDETTEFLCDIELLGPEGRIWGKDGGYHSRSEPSCSLDDIKVGLPYRFEVIYQVPQRYADQLVGLTLTDHSTAARVPVIRPPR